MSKVLFLALAAWCGLAQQRLVTLPITATDSQGRRVTDLTAAEVQVTDQGKPAPVVSFRNDTVGTQATNRLAPALSHVQVILFDVLNLSMAARQPAVEQIVRALEGRESSDAIYLYLLNAGGDLVPVRALPAEAPPSTAAAAPWTREVRPMLEKAMGPIAGVRIDLRIDVARRVQSSYAALETLAARMAPMPGRKNILWLTFGAPCALPTENGQIWDCKPTLNKVAARLEQANVAVSPVAMQSTSADAEATVTLQQFVELTGGKLYGGGDIAQSLADAVELARSSYRVQVVPPANGWDGKQHRLRATSTRKSVTLQTIQAYTAEKNAPAIDEKARAVALFQSPFDSDAIPMSVTVSPGPQPHSVHLRITMDPQDLLLTQQGDRYTGQLTLQVAAFLPDNRLQTYDPIPVNLNLTTEQVERFKRDGLHPATDAVVPENVRKLRLLVVDKMANLAGTVTIPLN